jgi:hypothetical protein
LFKAIAVGLGASISIVELVQIIQAAKVKYAFVAASTIYHAERGQVYFVSRIFGLLAQCLSKASVLIFTRRIFSGNFDGERAAFQIAYAAVALYGACAVTLSSANCHPGNTLYSSRDFACKANVREPSTSRNPQLLGTLNF